MVGSLVNLGRVIMEEGGEGRGDGYASCIRGRERERESWTWNIQCVYSSINLNSVMIHNPLFSTTIHALGIRTREECRHEDGGTLVNYLREIRFVMDDDSLDLLIL